MFRNEITMKPRPRSLPRTLPLRKRIRSQRPRLVDIRFLFPDVTMQHVSAVSRMTTRFEHANADVVACLCREDWSDWIAADLRVCQDVGEVEVARLVEWRVGWKTDPLPEWLSAIVDRFLTGVFRIFRFRQVRHGNTKRCRSEERRVGKECRSRWSAYH